MQSEIHGNTKLFLAVSYCEYWQTSLTEFSSKETFKYFLFSNRKSKLLFRL